MTVFTLIDWTEPLEELSLWSRNPEVLIEKAVQSGSNPEQCYVVRKVKILSKRKERADAVVDETEIWLCSCPDARYRRWFDSEPDEITSGIDCKHVTRHFKHEKAQNDEQQRTLDDNSNPVGK